MVAIAEKHPLLFTGSDWDFDTIRRIHETVGEVAGRQLGLDTYPNQIEVITAEQMLDAYASTGMPQLYRHWSFGKQFAHHEMVYRKGMSALAYEIVINSNPCISYIMEENTAMMQTLVIAHAAFGHNHFFKNNYLFRQWTDAEGILDYLAFARKYIAQCEERHGLSAVERLLDIAHSLQSHGVHRYPRRSRLDLKVERQREAERHAYREQVYNDLWRTVPGQPSQTAGRSSAERRRAMLGLPEENILYFLEKTAPLLQPWQREVLRIVRHVAQYFYPQSQTKIMNEGCATWCHYRIMTHLHEQGSIDDGAFLEFLQSHANVIMQPTYDKPYYNGLNPYAIGFAMMQDIVRICESPEDEDRAWFPDIAGKGDAVTVLKHVWENYRDESFLSQFLSPRLIREWRLFHLEDDSTKPTLRVDAIHDERGYRRIRNALSRQYDIGWQQADIQIIDVDLDGDRQLTLQHNTVNGILLYEKDIDQVLQNLAAIWGYKVVLREVDPATGRLIKEHIARTPQRNGPNGEDQLF
ncbi:SpoVR family protein [Pseudochelatococcus contaminans]|uniref:Spore cortex formation protein SpoVR/YcgB (Stage V sporulation) n=1 Tax=Pseudochelatococcus contaminans TaxID=1538103 RepID=A0A7W5Z356_9HYPH|nr:SpoVR family protein [Pseudochelatococcus contaminans]MBB3809158.1 spore cortex formation protein SpoVR/YcgB (stage V sporulation) [Pseudochelatococcus contaminans]